MFEFKENIIYKFEWQPSPVKTSRHRAKPLCLDHGDFVVPGVPSMFQMLVIHRSQMRTWPMTRSELCLRKTPGIRLRHLIWRWNWSLNNGWDCGAKEMWEGLWTSQLRRKYPKVKMKERTYVWLQIGWRCLGFSFIRCWPYDLYVSHRIRNLWSKTAITDLV